MVRVDHRSLTTQRAEAPEGGEQKAAQLDRAPQVRLGGKAAQMERHGITSDRGDQLRQVQEENLARHALRSEIARLRE